MIESKVFEDKSAALKHSRDVGGVFFATKAVVKGEVDYRKAEVYVVAASSRQAQLALIEYLYPLEKWDKRRQEREYIAVLEDAVTGGLDGTQSEDTAGSED